MGTLGTSGGNPGEVAPLLNDPILHGGLVNTDLFPMSEPASWCILIPNDR
jgi:hypothetical protein